MKRNTKLIAAACALLLSTGLAAQTYKCSNELGKITYSGKKCSELGLKDAGEVKDRLNINPALPTSSPSGEGRPRVPSAAPSAPPPAAPEAPPATEESPNPQRRCFTVNTPKGTATRCNDVPPSDAPPD